jgi:hypothetical protein
MSMKSLGLELYESTPAEMAKRSTMKFGRIGVLEKTVIRNGETETRKHGVSLRVSVSFRKRFP